MPDAARDGRSARAPEIHLLVDPEERGGEGTAQLVRAAVRGGVTVVQMRRKDGPARALLHDARALLAIVRPLGVPLIVNDRVDIAAAAEADGVHVGQGDMPPALARRILGPRAIIGLSVWEASQLEEATPGVVDYVGVGPIFPTRGKADAVEPIGVPALSAIGRLARVRVIAIGGIAASNAESVAAAGAHGVAVINAIGGADDPEGAASAIRASLERGAGRR